MSLMMLPSTPETGSNRGRNEKSILIKEVTSCIMIQAKKFYLTRENMKTFIIKEYNAPTLEGATAFDLSQTELKHCLGCWSCWWTTPGKCVYRDLDEFYREYLAADKVYIYCNVSQGFVTSNMKAMIDRMIVFVLPYISWDKGESCHEPRYDKYPSSVKVIYNGEFIPGEEDAFIAYWKRTLDMMFVKEISVKRYEAMKEVQQ